MLSRLVALCDVPCSLSISPSPGGLDCDAMSEKHYQLMRIAIEEALRGKMPSENEFNSFKGHLRSIEDY